MRDPSIHITQSTLANLLKETLEITDQKALTLAKKLVKKAFDSRVKGRATIIEKDKTVSKKLKKSVESENDYTEQFNRILTLSREQAKHNFTAINQTAREYTTLKEVTLIAVEFCKVFSLPVDIGFKEFIQLGFQLIGKKYALNKFKYHKENIFNHYSFSLEIQNDPKKKATEKFYEIWRDTMLTWSSMDVEITTVEKYVNLLYARQEADEAKADYDDWIEAQFQELAWLDVIPELTQLHGVNALERYEKWKIKNKKVKQEQETESDSPVESYLSKIRR
jgi:hypothetical protein